MMRRLGGVLRWWTSVSEHAGPACLEAAVRSAL